MDLARIIGYAESQPYLDTQRACDRIAATVKMAEPGAIRVELRPEL